MREAEAEYWKDKFENANSSSDFWRVVREMQGKSKGSVGAIKNEDGNIITNAKDKAESLNCFPLELVSSNDHHKPHNIKPRFNNYSI